MPSRSAADSQTLAYSRVALPVRRATTCGPGDCLRRIPGSVTLCRMNDMRKRNQQSRQRLGQGAGKFA
jgi:hypothetical protein